MCLRVPKLHHSHMCTVNNNVGRKRKMEIFFSLRTMRILRVTQTHAHVGVSISKITPIDVICSRVLNQMAAGQSGCGRDGCCLLETFKLCAITSSVFQTFGPSRRHPVVVLLTGEFLPCAVHRPGQYLMFPLRMMNNRKRLT